MKLFTKNKKGSLSLSMEAIVILILAVVMLGLALAFIQGMFSNLRLKATNTLDLAAYDLNPTEDQPVIFSPSRPEVKIDNTVEIAVGFYNSHQTARYWSMHIIDYKTYCGGTTETLCYDDVFETVSDDRYVKIEKDKNNGWLISMKPAQGATGNSAIKQYLFTIQFCGTEDEPTTVGTVINCTGTGVVTQQRQIFVAVKN